MKIKDYINRFTKVFMITLLGAIVISCQNEIFLHDGVVGEEEVMVRLSIKTPQPAIPKTLTRSIIDAESKISTVRVLVFEDNGTGFQYKYMAEGENLTSGGNQSTTFTSVLQQSNNSLKLYLIANANQVFNSYMPTVGDSEELLKANLKIDFTSRVSSELPMWGEVLLPSGITSGSVTDLTTTMLRSIARIDVVKDLAADSYAFEMQSVHVFRTNNLIQVVPNSLVNAKLQVNTPSVPSDATLNPYSTVITSFAEDLLEEFNESSEPIQTIRKLYIPEGNADETKSIGGVTCVVVGGKFSNDTEPTYYKIDFDSKLEGHPYGQILRNYKYIFNIRRVWGRGYTTPEDAAKNKSTNINVTVENWNDFTTDMGFDSEHYFGVSTRKLLLSANASVVSEIKVTTDMETYTVEWADESGNGFGNPIAPGEVLTNTFVEVTPSTDLTSIKVKTRLSNAGNNYTRAQNILLKANRFQILITLEQDKFNNSGRVIRILSVRSNLGYLGSTEVGNNFAAEARATGLRGILTNTVDFGPAGVVECAGYYLSDVTAANVNTYLTDVYISQFDVIYLPDIATQATITPGTAYQIVNWLNSSKNRFLVIALDEANRNKNTLDALGVSGVTWANLPGAFPLATKSKSIEYFTDNGPFTVNKGVVIPQNFAFRNNDAVHGEINIASNPSITPILTGPSGGIVMGVDYNKRVFYVGDVDLFNMNTGTGGTTDNRLTNTTGTINNNASLLIANMWAWIAQTVLAR